jgi:hypothetical protein
MWIFFRRGVTRADLNISGNCPYSSDLLMMVVIMGPSLSRDFFNRDVGMESKEQFLLGDAFTNFPTSSVDTRLNLSE